MKRVVLVQYYFHPDGSAVSQLMYDFVRELSDRGAPDVLVVRGACGSAYGRNRPEDVDLPGVVVRRIPGLRAGRRQHAKRAANYLIYFAGVFLYLLFRVRRSDVVLCMTSPPLIGFVAAMAVMFRRVRLVSYIQDLYPELFFDMGYVRRPWLVRKLQVFNRITYRRAEAIVVIGAHMERKIRRSYRGARGKVILAPNWPMDGRYRPYTADGRFVILYSGNMGPAHDFSHLDALVAATVGEPDLEFRFVGDGSRRNELAKRFGGSRRSRVTFGGYVDRYRVKQRVLVD